MYGEKSILELLNDAQREVFEQLPEKMQKQIKHDFYGEKICMFKVFSRDEGNYVPPTTDIYVYLETDKKLYTVAYAKKYDQVTVFFNDHKSGVYLFFHHSETFLNEVKREIEKVESYKCKK